MGQSDRDTVPIGCSRELLSQLEFELELEYLFLHTTSTHSWAVEALGVDRAL